MKKMKIYLDLCVFNRPFDYQGQERIALETGAFIYLIEQIEKERYILDSSGFRVGSIPLLRLRGGEGELRNFYGMIRH